MKSTVEKLDEETGCPLSIEHVCQICTKDQNRWGCYCELDDGDELVTANLFTRCPAGQIPSSSVFRRLSVSTFEQISKILVTIIPVRITPPASVKDCLITHAAVLRVLPVISVRRPYRVRATNDRSEGKINEWLGCTDGNVECPNGECREANNPLTPVYCLCYDGTRRDPRQNATCPSSRSFPFSDRSIPISIYSKILATPRRPNDRSVRIMAPVTWWIIHPFVNAHRDGLARTVRSHWRVIHSSLAACHNRYWLSFSSTLSRKTRSVWWRDMSTIVETAVLFVPLWELLEHIR